MFTHKNYVTRLSKYKSALKRLKQIGVIKVFADNIADAVGVTPVQVRKDFSIFGVMGNKKGGYQIDELINDLERLLGKNRKHDVIVVGYGNIGKALVNYPGFAKENINIVAVFDIDPKKINSDLEVPVLPIEELGDFVRKQRIKMIILAVPDLVAQDTLDIAVGAGVKGVLSFSSIQLRAPDDVFINYVDLEMELETIIFYTHSPVKEVK